jgi:signal transduction histidine kinase
MRNRLSLRRRVALSWLLFGAALSVVLAVVAIAVTEDFEHVLVDNLLRSQAHDLLDRYEEDPATPLPNEPGSRVYIRAPGNDGVPAEFAKFAPGFHEFEDANGDEVHVVVYARGDARLYFVLDLAAAEERERRLVIVLIVIVALGTSLSGWAGYAFAGAVIRPVSELAGRVDRLGALREPALATHFPRDEVGTLAAAFDRYQDRLRDAMSRERAFTADASHDLRTPIAVIRGAAEVLVDDPHLDDGTRERVKRMQRGIAELSDLLDALLMLARGFADPAAATETIAWIDVFAAVANDGEPHWRAQQIDVSFDATPDAMVRVHRRVAEVTLANLIRNAGQDRRFPCVQVRADARELSVAAFASPDARHDAEIWRAATVIEPGRSDRMASGIGMLARICSQLGWSMRHEQLDNIAWRVVIAFAAD